jgi:hypothetical protein
MHGKEISSNQAPKNTGPTPDTLVAEPTSEVVGVAGLPLGKLGSAGDGSLPNPSAHLNDMRLRTTQRQQMAKQLGELQGNRHFGSAANRLQRQVTTTLDEIKITGDANHFYQHARSGNEQYAKRLADQGWPYNERLRQLWVSQSHNAFANAVENYQIQVMGMPEYEVDGILGPRTAQAMQNHPISDAQFVPHAATESQEESATNERETGDSETNQISNTGSPIGPLSTELKSQASNTQHPWTYHQRVYDAWQREGKSLGIDGLPSTWTEFLNQMGEINFLKDSRGTPNRVAGHTAFLRRLDMARRYLEEKELDIRVAVGSPGARSQYRAGEGSTSYHVFGMEIDINGSKNPWIGNPERQYEARNGRYIWTIWRAAWLIGGGAEPVWPADSDRRSRALRRNHNQQDPNGTAELFGHFQKSSTAVRQYFALLSDEVALRTKLSNLREPPSRPPVEYTYAPVETPIENLQSAARTEDVDAWKGVIQDDLDTLRRFFGSDTEADRNSGAHDPAGGFMNQDENLVKALRDMAGLSWGACDLGGNESGDFMHFDLRTSGFDNLRKAIREEIENAHSNAQSQAFTSSFIESEALALSLTNDRQLRRLNSAIHNFFNREMSDFARRPELNPGQIQILQDKWRSSAERQRLIRQPVRPRS